MACLGTAARPFRRHRHFVANGVNHNAPSRSRLRDSTEQNNIGAAARCQETRRHCLIVPIVDPGTTLSAAGLAADSLVERQRRKHLVAGIAERASIWRI